MDKKDVVELRNQIERQGNTLLEIYADALQMILNHNEKQVDHFNEVLDKLDFGIEYIPHVKLYKEQEVKSCENIN